MSNKKVIYYYQTFIGLKDILEQKPICVTHIIVSSIHFGYNGYKNKKPYIHLNDNNPDDPKFNNLWQELEKADRLGITVMLMVGGAGGAYQELFSNYNIFYSLLKTQIKKRPFIKGIDLDVEEETNIDYIKLLINQIDNDFGKDFIITMAPVGVYLENNTKGMGGFSYQELFNTKEGERINWFNGQFYYNFSVNSYINTINNGYPASKIVLGMVSSQFNKDNFYQACQVIKTLSEKYSDFGGVFNWEYFDSPPNQNKPSEWSQYMKKLFDK